MAWGFQHQRIDKLMKKGIRIITLSKYNSHTAPLFKMCNILKVKDILALKELKLYYQFLHNKLPCLLVALRSPPGMGGGRIIESPCQLTVYFAPQMQTRSRFNIYCTSVCRLKPAEVAFLNEYCTVMRPVAQALNLLQVYCKIMFINCNMPDVGSCNSSKIHKF